MTVRPAMASRPVALVALAVALAGVLAVVLGIGGTTTTPGTGTPGGSGGRPVVSSAVSSAGDGDRPVASSAEGTGGVSGAPGTGGTAGAAGVKPGADGAPAAGLDPAAQPQISLDAAASVPGEPAGEAPVAAGVLAAGVNPGAAGVNEGTKEQASGVAMGPARRDDPGEVLSDVVKNGGCTPGYGTGVGCLPAVPPSHAAHADHDMTTAWTCAEARTLLPDGIAVSPAAPGVALDPLGLDTDADGVACGAGDSA